MKCSKIYFLMYYNGLKYLKFNVECLAFKE